jgi:two-component system, cell cycle response regulator
MDRQLSTSIMPEHSFALPPAGQPEGDADALADSGELVSQGMGKCVGKYFPHLLKYNFNKVLLVDDDPEIHVGFDAVLTSSGYAVLHAVSEIDAAEIIKESAPDFLMIDWKKSASSEAPRYESLRRASADKYLYIIVTTSEDLVRNKVQMVASGADAFAVKPVAAGELLSLLQAGTRVIEQQLLLKELAIRDPLTGLLNRRTFAELQEMEWTRAARQNESISCAMIDVDYFKIINDLYGHVHGDRVLARIAEIMKGIGRKSDIFCRYGGDEFCALMPNTDLSGALVCAERLRKTVAAEKRSCAEPGAFPTVTVGVATKTDGTKNFEALLEKADEALLWAKLIARDSVASYDSSKGAFAAYREEGS